MGVQSGHKAGPTRATDRCSGVGPSVKSTFFCKLIHEGRVHSLGSITCHVAADVLGHDPEDIWFLLAETKIYQKYKIDEKDYTEFHKINKGFG